MSTSYKLIIIGSSHLVNSEPVYNSLDAIITLNGIPEVVVTGDSKTGVDLMAKKWCKRNDIKLVQYALKEDNKIGHQDRNRDLLNAGNVLIAFPLHRRSKYVHQLIHTARSSDYRPHPIKAIFVHTQYLSPEDKKKSKKRARSCSPIREVDEKERKLKFSGSYITHRRKSPSSPPPTTTTINEDYIQKQHQQL